MKEIYAEYLEPILCLIVFIIAEFLKGIERVGLVVLYIITEICDTFRGNVSRKECEKDLLAMMPESWEDEISVNSNGDILVTHNNLEFCLKGKGEIHVLDRVYYDDRGYLGESYDGKTLLEMIEEDLRRDNCVGNSEYESES